MKLLAIGLGQAGGKIVDKFTEYCHKTGQRKLIRSMAINTSRTDLYKLKYISKEDRVLIGQSMVRGHGVGGNNELGAKVMAEEIYTVQSAIDRRGGHEFDAFLLVAGLGGGTGSGGAPVLARRLKKIYTEPVYGLGVLPSNEEGMLYALNATRSLMSLIKEVDGMILWDNESWRIGGSSLAESYDYMNDELVRRLGVLISAGEQRAFEKAGEMVVDASEIINTISAGGITTLGYAREPVQKPGFFRKPAEMEVDNTSLILSLIRKAALGRLTVPCEISSATRALIMIAGSHQYLDRRGLERGKLWIQEMIEGAEVRAGDCPIPGSKYVASVVLFSGISEVPRIKELQRQAREALEKIELMKKMEDQRIAQLFERDDYLKPLL